MARVIRGRARVLPRDVVDAKARAEAIVAEAHAQADQIRERTRAALEAEAQADADARVAASMVGIERARTEAIEELRGRLVSLVGAVARKVIGDTQAIAPQAIQGRVDEALSRVARGRRIRLRVHPEDMQHVAAADAEVLADDMLAPGDCVVESDLGDVDARLETRLERLLRALEEQAR